MNTALMGAGMGAGIAIPVVATSLARLGEPQLDPAELGEDGLRPSSSTDR